MAWFFSIVQNIPFLLVNRTVETQVNSREPMALPSHVSLVSMLRLKWVSRAANLHDSLAMFGIYLKILASCWT